MRPPRLGGNAAMGVWATRSPFRPNPLGLSCVELVKVDGLELVVKGADLMDGTPIYDIKPYIPYADAYPEARSGFVSGAPESLAAGNQGRRYLHRTDQPRRRPLPGG